MLTRHLNIHINFFFFELLTRNKNSIFSGIETLQGARQRLLGVLFDEIARQNILTRCLKYSNTVVGVKSVELISVLVDAPL